MHALSLLADAGAGHGEVHFAWVLPFALLLLTIAIFPLIHRHFWEHHYPKIAIGFGLIPLIYYFVIARDPAPWVAAMEEYIGFILLLASLYIVSGGVVIRVNRKATPLNNCALLAIGAVLANVFGTTGASMLLIRPFLHMNRGHLKPFHVVFFIFIVSNCGGLLTPIGDPPLFLGYLQGIPFGWTLEHLWIIWAVCNGLLLLVFFIIDTIDHRALGRASRHDLGPQVHVLGIHNVLFIALIVFAVFRPGFFTSANRIDEAGITLPLLTDMVFSRELLMVAAAILALVVTPKDLYQRNEFSYGPIKEVAVLFVAIFSTMAPALAYLETNADKLHTRTPGQYYFTTGTLSAMLDNAPTYLTFLRVRMGEVNRDQVSEAHRIVTTMHDQHQIVPPETVSDVEVRQAVESTVANHLDLIRDGEITPNHIRVAFLVGNPALNVFLLAVSAGAVLFGACTYIGNGPNFMVKSIAESHGCHMPGFLAYILRYTLPILLPIYVLIWYLFIY